MYRFCVLVLFCVLFQLPSPYAYEVVPAGAPVQLDAQQQQQVPARVNESIDTSALKDQADQNKSTTPIAATLKSQVSAYVKELIDKLRKSTYDGDVAVKLYKQLDFDRNGKCDDRDAAAAAKDPQGSIKKLAKVLADSAADHNFVFDTLCPETTKTSLAIQALNEAFEKEIGSSLASAPLQKRQQILKKFMESGMKSGFRLFQQAFKALCAARMDKAVELVTTTFGYSSAKDDENGKINMMLEYLIPQSLSAGQLAKLIQSKSPTGRKIDASVSAQLLTGCARNNGGQAAWEKAIETLLSMPGKWNELLGTIKEELTENPPMRDQFFLDLLSQVQKGKSGSTAASLYKACAAKGVFVVDKNVDLTKKYSEAQWKNILTKAKSSLTKAAAAAMIKDEKWMRSYFFANDAKKGLVMKTQRSDAELQGAFRAGTAEKWYGLLTNADEKKKYIQRVLSIDTTNYKKYVVTNELSEQVFVCHNYARQMTMAGEGPAKAQPQDPAGLAREGYTLPLYSYGIPIKYVNVTNYTADWFHGINAVFIGSAKDSIKDQSKWLFFEPQDDGLVQPGSSSMNSMPLDKTGKNNTVNIEEHTKIGPFEAGIIKSLVYFRVNSKGKLENYTPTDDDGATAR